MKNKKYSLGDQILIQLNQRLGYWFGAPNEVERKSPAESRAERPLSDNQRRHSAGLMRINHTGEVCAQALYEGQALTANNFEIKEIMHQAAKEEIDHLSWCYSRLDALGSHASYLNPIWYMGSFSLGLLAGALGDQWSLSFLAETERQVVAHIDHHLKQLPVNDLKSRAVLRQMRIDEGAHATMAIQNGAKPLPTLVKKAMQGMSFIMKKTVYWV